jgi:hypothetical protein
MVQQIVIKSLVPCVNDQCSFLIENQNTPLQILGTDRAGTGFHRTGGFTQNLFNIKNSTAPILISNMTFVEGSENGVVVECGDPTDLSQCAATFQLETSDVTFESVTMLHSKRFAVGSAWTKTLLQDVVISDTALMGIWTAGTNDLSIYNSVVTGVHVNGIFTSGPAITRGSISGNVFSRNHRLPRYLCGPNLYCPGGQIDFGPNTQKMDAFFNEFVEGFVDDPFYGNQNLGISGVEFQQEEAGMNDIRLIRNRMTRNSGWSIVKNFYPAAPFVGVRIFENVMYQNNWNGAWGNTQACAVINNSGCLPLGEASCESCLVIFIKYITFITTEVRIIWGIQKNKIILC